MLREKQKAVNIGIGLGIVCNLLASFVLAKSEALSGLTLPVALLGSALFIYGCVSYAQAKGHTGWLGLLGLLSILGLIILVCLSDRYPDGRKPHETGDPSDEKLRKW
jgi:hypothetical protein